jgi:hypothetical protein
VLLRRVLKRFMRRVVLRNRVWFLRIKSKNCKSRKVKLSIVLSRVFKWKRSKNNQRFRPRMCKRVKRRVKRLMRKLKRFLNKYKKNIKLKRKRLRFSNKNRLKNHSKKNNLLKKMKK